ncbi:MAG: Wzt carbohydrate-binding domain-containing protein, partial [Nitrososphaera sp.]|nr:Wzt carbohydrate-binding domain-containing protein [Nitrososphaera sp.]
QIRQDGHTKDVIEAYLSSFAEVRDDKLNLRDIKSRRGSGDVRFTALEFLDSNRKTVGIIRSGDSVVVRLYYEVRKRIGSPIFGLEIYSLMGTLVSQMHTYNSGFDVSFIPEGNGCINVEIQELNLMPGRYYISLFVANLGHLYHDVLQYCAVLDIEVSDRYGLNRGLTGSPMICLGCTWALGPS